MMRTGRAAALRRASLASLVSLVTTACGLSLSGLATSSDPSSLADGGSRDGAVAIAADGAIVTQSDDAPSDGDPSALFDAPDACPQPAPAIGQITALRARNPIAIDGDLADWSCVPFVALTESVGGYVRSVDGGPLPMSAVFAIAWDDTYVYAAVHVTDATITGDDPNNPYLNDSIELYFSADPAPNGDYSNVDHEFCIDHKNLAYDYQNGTATRSPPALTSITKVVPGGYVLEARIPATAFGGPSFAKGRQLGFDLALNDGDGNAQGFILIWADTSGGSCTCARCCCMGALPLPFCDTLRFGKLVLEE